MLNDVTLLIKTFERPEALSRLLDSIRARAFDGPILIADDSKVPYRDTILEAYGDLVTEYLCLPFNVGLSAGRNALLDRVQTPYFVLNDDDFVYGPETNLAWMRTQLATTDLDLLGGIVREPEQIRWSRLRQPTIKKTARALYRTARTLLRTAWGNAYSINRFHGTIERKNGTVALTHNDAPNASPYRRCDYVLNFFMAKTDAVRSKVGGWAPELKLQEHWEFFYRAQQGGLRVAHTDDVAVFHHPDRTPHYDQYREHQAAYRRRGLSLHGLRELRIGPLLRISVDPDEMLL
jgi:glycosyltransferase involved in cell wall biosynthesis